MSSNLIALLTDFGEKDYFAGAMKGVILSINPKAKIIDISHQNPKHDVKSAAFTLLGASRNFPPETNFVVVVDPGVGTDRKCILLRTKNNLNFIGPDNGVFTLVANHYGVEEIREISNEELELPQVSSTFHGRDVMAPVAAHLSCDLEVSEVGPEIESIESFQVSEPEIKDEGLVGEVIHVDDFGNLITNIGKEIVRSFP
ncbi:MAG: SAM-dependent chlorinase/fluorinase, partial [Hadesarchaea archaeon]|nr:SAM-dependent chlorinase/fluorinase [Hadesarchaea archaeon]